MSYQKEKATELFQLMQEVMDTLDDYSPAELKDKPKEDVWSKQEILGHLIDSSQYNIRRFTESQFMPSPYKLESYPPNEMVEVNKYNMADILHMTELFHNLNKQVVRIFAMVTDENLKIKISDPKKEINTLQELMEDYIVHMQNHLNQITQTVA
jgi:uncharacterized damage-inducible protein DinB